MPTMTQTLPTVELFEAGQSPWLDNISRELIKSGKLKSLIQEKGVLGVTSNPSIFEKAIGQAGGGYDADVKRLYATGASTFETYDALTIADIRKTCDLFLPVFKKTKGGHGFVSLEVSPDLAYDALTTISEAKRLFKAVARPNLMIKIPATPEGLSAIRAVIGSGINVNITLMFSMKHYQGVAQAYIDGLADYKAKGGDLRRVYSVASVFVSRIDTYLDKKLDELAVSNPQAKNLKGKAAVANSKLIYQEFKKIFGSDKFLKLQKSGATIQKVLWGSTSCKNPAYPDLLYVETLVGPDTVNTMPQVTLDAVLDHGNIKPGSIEEGVAESREAVSKLSALGFDLNQIGETLQKDGVRLFIESFESLMKTLELKREAFSKQKKQAAKETYSLSSQTVSSVKSKIAALEGRDFLNRFLKGDANLWKSEDYHQASINNRLGWMTAHDWIMGKLYEIDRLREQLLREKYKDMVLLGMGGSSLAPEVISLVSKRSAKSLRFHVLDTTDPATVFQVQKKINLKSTVFIVASKSGGTIETMSQFHYFYDLVTKAYGKKAAEKAGAHFVAITDSGSSLQKLGAEKKFRKVLINPSNIGGRYSALSFFGMLPAILMGADVRPILKSAREFAVALRGQKDLNQNPGVYLGIVLAALDAENKDKLTFLSSKTLMPVAAWLEQLIAESTGKEGKGIVPIEGKKPADPALYGPDRVFVVMKMRGEAAKDLDQAAAKLKKAGFSVIVSEWPSDAAIGAEFLKWEIATAVAGIVMQINPFDEPNVKEAKDFTNRFLDMLKEKGKYENPKNYVAAGGKTDWDAFFSQVKKGGYLALLVYAERTPQVQQAFNRFREEVREAYKLPVLLGFGPRYLHSIGQLYKGGTLNGLFLAFVKRETKDAKIPGTYYTFGQLKKAQAFGDIQALESKGLPVLTLDLGKNVTAGIETIRKQLQLTLSKTKTKRK